ncbi:calcium:proton antiporter [Methylolobus aquaticus]
MHDSTTTKPQTPLKRGHAPHFWGLVPIGVGWLLWGLLKTESLHLPLDTDPATALGYGVAIFGVMLGCVSSVVRRADRLAELLREPVGTLILTLSATLIEGSLMLAVMLEGRQNPTLLRDTVFATLMLSMNALVGLALTGGAWRHREQSFNLRGALSFLHLIIPLSLMLLILPNYTRSTPGPTLAPHQEAFLGGLCLVVYALFLLIQTGRHRSYFDHLDVGRADQSSRPLSAATLRSDRREVAVNALELVASLLPVLLLAKFLGRVINYGIDELGAPTALGGLIIASLGLMSEGAGALRAALANRMQRAVNICLGSSLATIGLTVPAVLLAAGWLDMQLTLGLAGKDATLLAATLLSAMLTFVSGSANLLQGIVHLMLFFGYVMFILFP